MKSAALALTFVALAAPTLAAASDDVLIEGVPHVRQRPDFCGEACVEMWAKKLGKPITQDDVFAASGLDPLLARGCWTPELAVALKKLGFATGPVWTKIRAERASAEIARSLGDLRADLARGVPSIVCMHYDDRPQTTEHFRLVLGFDAKKDEVIYHEPAEDGGAYRRMARAQFAKLWPLGSGDEITLIRLKLEAGDVAAPARPSGFGPADYAQHAIELKKKLGDRADRFPMLIEPPFFVLGDESKERVRAHAARTVRWAVDKLKRDYFDKDPSEIIDVWLFKDRASYEANTKRFFGETPFTPFGYYSPRHKALIMNIGTGGGTLVHEIVHPFVHANFPECPAWLNEGLGSLYEQCDERDGHIRGLTNWRLDGLKSAIRAEKVPSFETLTKTSSDDFYNHDRGTNYGQARYLCYYLQEKDLLLTFYKQFKKNHENDPTGYKTLVGVLGESDMASFQKRWEKFVLELSFP